MQNKVYDNSRALGKAAGQYAAQLIREAIQSNATANIILATGTSQFETLHWLTKDDVDWTKVTMFHLDEYIGLPETHHASFSKYLKERFIAKLNSLKAAYLINSKANPQHECKRLNELITRHPIDVALVGIGENAHLAFNDPPADFETEEPYIVVELDEACRIQQMNEGWFQNFNEVPQKAISMSVKQIMKSKHIVCSVPGERKATAIKNCFENEVSNLYPGSILQIHKNCVAYLDKNSASLLQIS